MTSMQAFFVALVLIIQVVCKPPNILFILTDDQDVYMNGTGAMIKTLSKIGHLGATFKNMYVTTPLCCPSRSSILTGTYVHNHRAINNSISGNCSSSAWQKGPEQTTIASQLKTAGYKTFFAGKYLNQYGKKVAGGVQHVPPGWDEWHGLVGNSVYYNYSLSVNGVEEKHGDDPEQDYLTDVIHNRAEKFLIQHLARNTDPFFMMLSTPACHAPFTPHPKYATNFSDMAAPRTPNFNKHGDNKHWLLRQAKTPMGNESMVWVDNTFKNRWRTLLSVDDMISDMVDILTKTQVLNETYVIFSSDNGFHLGQFSLPNDKRQMYEFDIHVPLMVRGPGVKPGTSVSRPVKNIDLMPTMLDLAGIKIPAHVDGESFKNTLIPKKSIPIEPTGDFLVEHVGEYDFKQPGCPQLDGQPLNNCFPDCVCEDSFNNTYLCVRRMSDTDNYIYCGFADSETFVEVYDLNQDPHQLTNIASSLNNSILESLEESLANLAKCRGSQCRGVGLTPERHFTSKTSKKWSAIN